MLTYYYKDKACPMSMAIGKINISNKFITINNLSFSLILKIIPIRPIKGQINKEVSPVGFRFVKLLNKSTGNK